MRTLFLAAALITGAAQAQATYDYAGQVMTGTATDDGGGLDVITPTTDQAFLEIVLPQALNPNQANQVVDPLSYVLNFPIFGPYSTATSFSLSTSGGAVTAWDVTFSGYGGDAIATLAITSAGDNYNFSEYAASCPFVDNGACLTTVTSNMTAGVWTAPAQAPELDGRGIASGLTLLVGMIAVWTRRRSAGGI